MAKHAAKTKEKKKKDDVQPESGGSAYVPYGAPGAHGPAHSPYVAPEGTDRVVPVFTGSSIDMGRASKKGASKKTVALAIGIIVAVLVAIYLAGTVFFMGRFFPNTTMGPFDISLKTSEGAQTQISQAAEDYTLTVKGLRQSFTATSNDVGLTVDAKTIMDEALADNEPWTWPVAIFQVHDETDSFAASSAADEFNDSVRAKVEEYNQTALMPVNATIAFDENLGAFKIVPEQEGSAFDPEKVVACIDDAIINFESTVKLGDDEMIEPTLLKDDRRLEDACDKANKMILSDLELMMDGNLVTEITPELISQWITLDADVNVVFADDAFGAWIDQLIEGCNTVGTTRNYTRPDGKKVTVSGGSYGWEIDGEALRAAIVEAVDQGTKGALDIPVLQSGNGFTGLGSQDWGPSYIDIDLAEQHARFYDDAGALVWESDIISGSPGEHATPEGVYYITWGMASPSMLIGEMVPETGEPEYETEVSYWMPFVGNSIGLHDAIWQYSGFGGDLYKRGYGSHGCVNLPLDKAADLYSMVQKGDVVVVHS